MRPALACAAVLAIITWSACDRGGGSERAPRQEAAEAARRSPAPLTDLSSSLAPVREAFNAGRGQARFLTLLAPT